MRRTPRFAGPRQSADGLLRERRVQRGLHENTCVAEVRLIPRGAHVQQNTVVGGSFWNAAIASARCFTASTETSGPEALGQARLQPTQRRRECERINALFAPFAARTRGAPRRARATWSRTESPPARRGGPRRARARRGRRRRRARRWGRRRRERRRRRRLEPPGTAPPANNRRRVNQRAAANLRALAFRTRRRRCGRGRGHGRARGASESATRARSATTRGRLEEAVPQKKCLHFAAWASRRAHCGRDATGAVVRRHPGRSRCRVGTHRDIRGVVAEGVRARGATCSSSLQVGFTPPPRLPSPAPPPPPSAASSDLRPVGPRPRGQASCWPPQRLQATRWTAARTR